MEKSAVNSTRWKIKLYSSAFLRLGTARHDFSTYQVIPLPCLLFCHPRGIYFWSKVTFFQSGVDPSALPMWDFHFHLMHSKHTMFWDQTILCSCWARRKIRILHSELFLLLFGLFRGNFLFFLLSRFKIEKLFILITVWWTQNVVNTEFCRCLFFLADSMRRRIAGKVFFFPFCICIPFLSTRSKYENVFVFNLFWVVFYLK